MRAERGFSLLELVVVVTIVGILTGIAIPTFLSAYWTTEDKSAQSDLRSASKAAWVYATEHDGFATDPAGLDALEPGLDFVPGDTASTGGTVSVAEDAGGQELALAVLADSGTCFYLRLSRVTEESRHADTGGACKADAYRDGPNTGW